MIWWQDGKRAKALESIEEGLRLDPGKVPLQLLAGLVLAEMGRIDEGKTPRRIVGACAMRLREWSLRPAQGAGHSGQYTGDEAQ